MAVSGKTKAIGVSNFEKNHLEDIISMGEMLPALNQVSDYFSLQVFGYWCSCTHC